MTKEELQKVIETKPLLIKQIKEQLKLVHDFRKIYMIAEKERKVLLDGLNELQKRALYADNEVMESITQMGQVSNREYGDDARGMR